MLARPTCRARRSPCSATPARTHRRARPRSRRALRARPATSSRARRRRARCCACAPSCSTTSTSAGPRARARQDRARGARAVRPLLRAPGGAAAEAVGGADAGQPGDRLPRRDDRPLRHPRLDDARFPQGLLHSMPRYTDDSRERVRDAVDMIALVARGPSCARRPAALHRPVPVPRGAVAVVRHRPDQEALPLLRLRRGWRRLQVRDGDRGAGLQRRAGVAGRRGGIELEVEAEDRRPPSVASARAGCWSCWSARPRTTSATCGLRGGRPRARVPARSAGSTEEALREVPGRLFAERLGHGDERLRRAGYANEEIFNAGLAVRGARRAGV